MNDNPLLFLDNFLKNYFRILFISFYFSDYRTQLYKVWSCTKCGIIILYQTVQCDLADKLFDEHIQVCVCVCVHTKVSNSYTEALGTTTGKTTPLIREN